MQLGPTQMSLSHQKNTRLRLRNIKLQQKKKSSLPVFSVPLQKAGYLTFRSDVLNLNNNSIYKIV